MTPRDRTPPVARDLAPLFSTVRQAEDCLPAEFDLARARQRLVRTLAEGPRGPRAAERRARWSLAFAAVVALVVLMGGAGRALVGRGDSEEAVTHPALTDDGPTTFEDGTTVTLAESARAHVESISSSGATVRVDRGRIRANVVHRSKALWHFRAGSYDVRVTGTSFDLAWDPAREHLRLTMLEGSVRVTGPSLEAGRAVRAGEVLDLGTDAPSTAAPTSSSTTASSGAVSMDDPRGVAPGREPSKERATWRDLALAGRFLDSTGAAEREGFEAICDRAIAGDLLLLGDAARLAEKDGRAADAYRALRRRFPHDARATTAAFMLGRMAFERRAEYAEAAGWFAMTVHEQPDGPLAREAQGRLMEAKERSGDGVGAKEAARVYLARYPRGPRARLAADLSQP